jgi:hypothetical protein
VLMHVTARDEPEVGALERFAETPTLSGGT